MDNTNNGIQLYQRKIDMQGNYVPFPGYTIVAHAIHPLPQPLVDLVNYLYSSELKKYYSFLPASSYHVTINPLENVHDEHRFLLEEEQRRIKEQNTLTTCTVKKIKCTKVILIEVEFKNELNLNFENIITFIRSHNLRDANILHKYVQPWHLTLAYQYKDVENEEIKTRLDQIITGIPQTSKLSFNIPLDHIRICHYDDMTKFTPL